MLPNPNHDHDQQIALIVGEIGQLRTSSESLMFSFDRVFAVGSALAVAGVAAGVTSAPVVLALLPFPVAGLYVFFLQLNAEGLSRAGHRRYLEERVNELLGNNLFIEETYVAPSRHGKGVAGSLGVATGQGLQACLLVILMASGAFVVSRYSWYWITAYWTCVFMSLFTLAASVYNLWTSYARGYDSAALSRSQAPLSTPLLAKPTPPKQPRGLKATQRTEFPVDP